MIFEQVHCYYSKVSNKCTVFNNPWKSSCVERKAIGKKYTRRAKIHIFASMTVVNFTVLPEPQK